MQFIIFLISLIFLCVSSFISFLIAARAKSKFLCIFAPLIILAGSFIYFTYISVLGYPIQKSWENIPDTFTVIFYRVYNKEKISLWLLDRDSQKSRIVEVPYNEKAEEKLREARKNMAMGSPVTFFKEKTGIPVEGTAKQKGDNKEGSQKNKEKSNGGWLYEIKSIGIVIPGDSLPPK